MRLRSATFCMALVGLIACEGPVGPQGPEGPQGPPGSDAAAPVLYYKILADTLHYQDDSWHALDTLSVNLPASGTAIVTFTGMLTLLGSYDDTETTLKLLDGQTELFTEIFPALQVNIGYQYSENFTIMWTGPAAAGIHLFIVQARCKDPDQTPDYKIIGSKLVVVFFPDT